MIAPDMRKFIAISMLTAVLALVAGFACGGDDDGGTPEPQGPTTLAVDKAFVPESDGSFTFTVQVTNTGDNAAVFFDLSDVWEEGLEVSSLGDFDGEAANPIGDTGFDVLLDEFEAGESKDIVYKATCVQSGQWVNTTVVTADNAESASTSVSVSCP
jgi:hypothetical protein